MSRVQVIYVTKDGEIKGPKWSDLGCVEFRTGDSFHMLPNGTEILEIRLVPEEPIKIIGEEDEMSAKDFFKDPIESTLFKDVKEKLNKDEPIEGNDPAGGAIPYRWLY